MKNKEVERHHIQLCLGILFFAITTLAPTLFEKYFKYSYKNWLAEDHAAFFTAYQANKYFENGEYGASTVNILWANYCRLIDSSSCTTHFDEFYAESQQRLEIDFAQADFTEQKYQVGADEVTVISTNNIEAWKEWGVLKDGTLMTVAKLGGGRKTEVLTDEEVTEKMNKGQVPAFLFRIEEDDSADGVTIPVAKTQGYTGKDFGKMLQEPGTTAVGVDQDGTLRLVRGGEVEADEFTVGSKLYWPLVMDAPTFEKADDYRNLFSHVAMNNNVYCYKEPSYQCNWVSSLARASDGAVLEIRLPMSLLYDENAWKMTIAFLNEKGVRDWTFSDPMFEDSMVSAADVVVPRDVLDRPEYSNGAIVETDTQEIDPVSRVRTEGVVDGLYLVIWQEEDQKAQPVLLEVSESSFLKGVDSNSPTP